MEGKQLTMEKYWLAKNNNLQIIKGKAIINLRKTTKPQSGLKKKTINLTSQHIATDSKQEEERQTFYN